MTVRNPRILFVLPSLLGGGAERQVLDLVNGLSLENPGVHLLTFERELTLLPFLQRDRVAFHNIPRRTKTDFSPAREIARIVDRERIEIIHSSLPIALLYSSVGRSMANRKPRLFAAIHITVNRNLKAELFDRTLYAPLMRRCDRIVMVCDNQRTFWSKKYPSLSCRMVTIYNGIDMERFRDDILEREKTLIRAIIGAREGEFLVGMVAGLRIEKGHEYAFRALRHLLDKGLKVRLVLVGDGERRGFLEGQARRLKIVEQLSWLGFQMNPKPYLSIVDAILISSYTETFPLSLLEALAMGKPAIATSVGGIPEIVTAGVNGLLVVPRDPVGITEAIACLAGDPAMLCRLSENARNSVFSRFSVESMVREYSQFFQAEGLVEEA